MTFLKKTLTSDTTTIKATHEATTVRRISFRQAHLTAIAATQIQTRTKTLTATSRLSGELTRSLPFSFSQEFLSATQTVHPAIHQPHSTTTLTKTASPTRSHNWMISATTSKSTKTHPGTGVKATITTSQEA